MQTNNAKLHLRKATALEPYFSLPYFPLAYILAFDEKHAEAAEMYLAFAARAPRGDENPIGRCRGICSGRCVIHEAGGQCVMREATSEVEKACGEID